MSKRGGKVFVDTNILVHAAAYENENVFEWIHSLYEEVYIHQMVLNEMLHDSARQKVQQYIDTRKWYLFNPDDESYLSDELYEIYESYVENMKQLFRNLNHKKQEQGRCLKGTNDLGEIHCLAAALLLSAKIICSNDGDIQEIIDDNELEVASDDEASDVRIIQDTLLDFCFYTIKNGLASESKVRKFMKAFQKEKLHELDVLLADIEFS